MCVVYVVHVCACVHVCVLCISDVYVCCAYVLCISDVHVCCVLVLCMCMFMCVVHMCMRGCDLNLRVEENKG